MKEAFPFIQIENKNYPTVILGGDRFLGLFGKPRHSELTDKLTNKKYIYEVMEACYTNGFRGFDISINENVIGSFKELKNKFPDCVGIGNPNWDCGINLKGEDLGKFSGRINATLFRNVFSKEDKEKISKLSKFYRDRWFSFSEKDLPLTKDEIASIDIDLEKYQEKLNNIKDVVDFCLIGTGYADWLPLFGRMDIFEKLIKLVRKNGMIPISVHHWTSLVLPELDKLNFAGHWTYLNKDTQLLDEEDVLETIKKTSKPITAFKALLSRKEKDVQEYLEYLFNVAHVDAVDFGVETIEEAGFVSDILRGIRF